jgi:hypothetical protein
MVAGNFDRRGPADVVVSSGSQVRVGRVTMLRGTPSGLTATRSRTISGFGFPFAAGDVDGDGDDDLLVGNSGDTVGGLEGAGRVLLVRGGTGGITTEGVQQFSADTAGVPGRAHATGGFGRCVELIDLDGDGRTEAVIAHERITRTFAAIANVTILPATPSGLTGRGAWWVQASELGATGFGCPLAG